MQEYTFTLTNEAGQSWQVQINDTLINYVSCRQALPEQTCVDLINAVKKESGKKLAIVWGNCQTAKLKNFLLNNVAFSEEYLALDIPNLSNAELVRQFAGHFKESFWSCCDLLISQRVKNDNKFNSALATQNLPSLLPESAKIIWIPNIFFDGYFPQRTTNHRNVDTDKPGGGRFPHGDKYVDDFMKNLWNGGGGGRLPN